MNTSYSYPDALIVLGLIAALVAWLYWRHKDRQRRLEIVHQERLVAMDKGIPLPELPSEPAKPAPDPTELLLHGVVWIALGLGGAIAMRMTAMDVNGVGIWPLTMPLILLGAGLVLVYVLRRRYR